MNPRACVSSVESEPVVKCEPSKAGSLELSLLAEILGFCVVGAVMGSRHP
jgi:hypothetical protein